MENKENKVGKSIIYNSLGSGVYLFCQWIITFIVVWIAGYEVAGMLSIAMSVATTYVVIATFNMRNYQSSDIVGNYSEKTYLVSRVFTSSIAILVTIVYSALQGFSFYQFLCINIFMLFKIGEAATDILHGSLQKKWRFDVIGISYFGRGVISVAFFSLGLYLTKDLLVALSLMAVGTIIFIVLYDVRMYKYEYSIYGGFKFANMIRLLLQCVPMVLYGLLFNYVSMYPRVAVEEKFGTELLGFYASVAAPALIIQTAATFIFNPFISIFANHYNDGKLKDFRKLTIKILLFIAMFGIVGVVLGHFVAPLVLPILFGSKIVPYVYLFDGVVIISTMTAIIWFLGTLLVIVRNYFALLLGAVASVVVTLATTEAFLNKHELAGINVTLIVALATQAVVYLLFAIFTKEKCNVKQIYYIRSTSILNDSRASKEISSLISGGYDVTVVGWDRDERIKDYKNVEINKTDVKALFFKFKAGYGESARNVLGLVLFQFWLLFKLIKDNKKYKYVHACDFDCGFMAMIACSIFNKKLVYDMYDYYSDSRPMSPFVTKIINSLENAVINSSYASIICGEWRTEQIAAARPNRLFVIHNTPEISGVEHKNMLKSNANKIKIVYAGILQDHRLILEILDKIKNHTEYELHIAGFGKYEQDISAAAQEHDNIFFYGSLPYADVLSLESECDILFATYDPDIKNHKYSAPNKVYEAMALGKPIIVCKDTGIDKLVIENNTGCAIEYNAESFIEGIKLLVLNEENLEKIKINAQRLYNEQYSWKSMELKLLEIYENNDSE